MRQGEFRRKFQRGLIVKMSRFQGTTRAGRRAGVGFKPSEYRPPKRTRGYEGGNGHNQIGVVLRSDIPEVTGPRYDLRRLK